MAPPELLFPADYSWQILFYSRILKDIFLNTIHLIPESEKKDLEKWHNILHQIDRFDYTNIKMLIPKHLPLSSIFNKKKKIEVSTENQLIMACLSVIWHKIKK